MQSWTRAAAAAAHFPDFPAQMLAAQQAGWRRSRAGSVLLAGWCRQAGRATGRQQDRVGNGPCEKNVDFEDWWIRGAFKKNKKKTKCFGVVDYFMAERFTFY
jgi:hypothetical protein